MQVQKSLFDSLEADDQVYRAGDAVYYVMLDSVEKCIVDDTFECANRNEPFAGPTVRYRATRESGGRVFGKYDIGETVFDSREEAEAKGALNLIGLGVSVIRSGSILPDEYVAYREARLREHMNHALYGCCALVGGTMVYRKGGCSYHFLDDYNDEKAARRAFRKELSELKREFERYEFADAPFEAGDCYGVGDGRWAACEYAYNNWFGGRNRM